MTIANRIPDPEHHAAAPTAAVHDAGALARATEKVEAVVRLAGGVAHDFNNLLTIILGNTEAILEEQTLSRHRGELQEIADAARRAATLTHQLLAFSRQLVLHPRATDLGAVVAAGWDELLLLAGPGVALRRHVESPLGTVHVDPAHVEQVLTQLVRNAIEALPPAGAVDVELRVVEVDAEVAATRHPMPPGRYVCLEVRDNGHGMDPVTLARAMEPFFTTKGQKHGTGMGLPTVFGIVKQSGGFMWLDSTPAVGTRCQVYLPQMAPVELMARTRTPVRPRAQGVRGVILLVEDESLVRQLTMRTLERAGYQVVEAANAHLALTEVRERGVAPDLLLTDVVMPGLDGRELATILEGEVPGMAVILMSGFMDPRPATRTLDTSRRGFLAKPFSLELLRERVRAALEPQLVE